MAEPKINITDAFNQLNEFLSPATRVWSHATFDFVSIMDTFRQLAIKPNISYKSAMDLRTLVYLAGTKVTTIVRTGTHHDALEDCKHQVKYCVAALNAIKESKALLQFIERAQT